MKTWECRWPEGVTENHFAQDVERLGRLLAGLQEPHRIPTLQGEFLTRWFDVHVRRFGDANWHTLTLPHLPAEPMCPAVSRHVWRRERELVGSAGERPGVYGSRIRRACLACGAYSEHDTAATHPDTGEQLHSTWSYRPPDANSLHWIRDPEFRARLY